MQDNKNTAEAKKNFDEEMKTLSLPISSEPPYPTQQDIEQQNDKYNNYVKYLEDHRITIEEIKKYRDARNKTNSQQFDDVEIIQQNEDFHDSYTYKEIFNSAYNDLHESAQTNKQDVIRKVVFYNNKKSGHHIACFVLFYDKNNQDKPISLFTGTDNDLKNIMWNCVEDGEHNFWQLNSKKFLNIQKDSTSCGVVACEMAKHLTVDWYKKHMIKMKDLEQADINILKRYKQQQGCISVLNSGYFLQYACRLYKINDIADIGLTQEDAKKANKEIIDLLDKKMQETEQQYLSLPTRYLPKELIAYKQGGLKELAETYTDIFKKNLQRGNIKRIIESENDTHGKPQNRRLQERSLVIKNYDEHITKKDAKRLIEDYINNNRVQEKKPIVDCIKKLQKYDDGKEFLRNCHCNIALRARAKREHQVFLTYEKIQNENPANVNELVSMDNVKSWNMCGCSCC